MEKLARRCQSGKISVAAWRAAQAREVKALHLANLAAAKGGFHALTPADFGRVGRAVRTELDYLRVRAQRAANDPDYLASERFIRDAASYSGAGRGTFEAVRLEEERPIYKFEYNKLDDAAHHCVPKNGRESCQQQTDKGIVPIGTIVLPTRRACGNECRCKIVRLVEMPKTAN
jgi:hypothetical protein